MVDIKTEAAAGKPLPLSEKPLADNEKLKQSLENFNNKEKTAKLEQSRESVIEEISQAENSVPVMAGPSASIMAPQVKIQEVERVLSLDMEKIYLSLTPKKRQEFKIKGEETAKKISRLLTKAKVSIGEIISLIKKWLSIIPGLNKYFLEKEAKIKADEIVKIKSN